MTNPGHPPPAPKTGAGWSAPWMGNFIIIQDLPSTIRR
eukprot:CAMPEP_0182896646 /NCGR_PEP_ID=MMETSP0034_2-20130328/26405_1 /TAXON_ID=156128 /ORGANISM="Nephroselmis pyriformis, Strain CCMP717" /LENGTH=37 /DNA_ID= /DNA_START= /DNA_END= /DNA_ORIENTATION=